MAGMTAPLTPLDPRVEMFQRGTIDPFFNMKALAPRPLSTSTDIYDDTDFEEGSDLDEEPGDYSPRISLNSAGRRSQNTLSSEEDLPTPRSNKFQAFDFDLPATTTTRNSANAATTTSTTRLSVEGPKGPHLFFRNSTGSEEILKIQEGREEDFYLTMSPLTPAIPKTPTTIHTSSRPNTAFRIPPIPQQIPLVLRPISALTDAVARLDAHEVETWSAAQVARWMTGAGFEPSIVEKFEEHDISGAILVTLKFEDLRELDVQSFGQRHKLWAEIQSLRGDANNIRPTSPTVIDCGSDSDSDSGNNRRPRRRKASKARKHKKPGFDDIISPLESVSIVGIEQLMPKPHKCAKGDKCSKWRKQQRIIAEFNKEHPGGQFSHPVSPKGGRFLIAGDPGNPFTAAAERPFSDAMPSVVASSDVLGPGSLPAFAPQQHAAIVDEESLASILTRDPQDNVRQFLNFQHVDPSWGTTAPPEEPATPPYEMFPTLPPTPAFPAPNQNLRLNLPRLAIPSDPTSAAATRNPAYRGILPPRSASAQGPVALGPMDRAAAISPDLRNPPPVSFWNNAGNNGAVRSFQQPQQVQEPYRYGTPASEMDVGIPVTLQDLGPVAREASQSVPPNMSYRPGVPLQQSHSPPQLSRSTSRASRRPTSYLPRLDENVAAGVVPPRPNDSSSSLLSFLPPPTTTTATSASSSNTSVVDRLAALKGPNEETHSGWMKKRKTRLLRHEWVDVHASLRGTKLAMVAESKEGKERGTTKGGKKLEDIDVEGYNITCSSNVSTSKLSSALKAMNITHGSSSSNSTSSSSSIFSSSSKRDIAAFNFQLVPEIKKDASGRPLQGQGRDGKVRKRESLVGGGGKVEKLETHHFAVNGREERIDWMRELMLAKALGRRAEGFEVLVNGVGNGGCGTGNMI